VRFLPGACLIIVVGCGAAASHHTFARASQLPSTAPKPSPTPVTPAQANPNQEINDRFVKQLAATISGQENEPADAVFMNIQIESLKNVPAGRFLRIMNAGYSRALGVACTHCHVEQDFASDDKRPKRAAREMAIMHQGINDQLAKMQHLETKPEDRFINCSTCHRGQVNPIATNR
jgi:hypothetical protein